MDAEVFLEMASHEGRHWWFVGRRAIVGSVIALAALPSEPRILEAGCGTGGNLAFLTRLGRVTAFDPHAPAVDLARMKADGAQVTVGSLPDAMPAKGGPFDLVLALDVLEHIEDDLAALQALVRSVAPGGYIVVTVPTHPLLWGQHDRRLHHVRRYGTARLLGLLAQAELDLVYEGPFNTILSPIAAIARLAEKLPLVTFGNQERLPPDPINRLLGAIFAFEAMLIPRRRLPIGLSHIALLQRRR